MKCLEVIFIRLKVKGYLKNITENQVIEFDEKAIKSKNKITYISDGVRNTIKINNKEVIMEREEDNFINTFVFNIKNSYCNYLVKDGNYDVDINVKTTLLDVKDNFIYIKYEIVDSECQYEYKMEMSEIL